MDVVGRELTPGGRLLRWNPDGTIKDLTENTGIYDVQQPDVSFDGTQIAFSAVTEPEGQWPFPFLAKTLLRGTHFNLLATSLIDMPNSLTVDSPKTE